MPLPGFPVRRIDERRIGMRRHSVAFGDAQAGVPAPHRSRRFSMPLPGFPVRRIDERRIGMRRH
jgi:hypothetical protein